MNNPQNTPAKAIFKELADVTPKAEPGAAFNRRSLFAIERLERDIAAGDEAITPANAKGQIERLIAGLGLTVGRVEVDTVKVPATIKQFVDAEFMSVVSIYGASEADEKAIARAARELCIPLTFHDEEQEQDHRCNQCEAAMINHRYCHEHGCPNRHKIKVDGEWVSPDEDDDNDDSDDNAEYLSRDERDAEDEEYDAVEHERWG